MSDDIVNVLRRVAKEPGLCTAREIMISKMYYKNLKQKLDVFNVVHGYLPQGLTVDSILDDLQYYVNRFKETK